MRTLLVIILILSSIQSGLACGKGRKKGKPLGPQNNQPEGPVYKRLLGPAVEADPYDAGSDSPGDCSQLKCNLDDNPSCPWTNNQPPADQLNWVKGHGQADPNLLQQNFQTSEAPQGNFFMTASDVPGTTQQTAQLYSAPIQCSNGDITVKLKHWQSKSTTIEVCQTSDPASPPSNCQALPLQSGKVDQVTIPKGENVRVVIQARGFTEPTGSVAVVDDIEVTCDPCVSTPPPEASTPSVPPVSTSGPAPCKVECNFEQGNPCAYQPASSGGGATENWGVKSVPYQNRLTGIVKKSGDGDKFGAAYTKKAGEKTTLSVDDNFDKEYVVRYRNYKATEGVTVKGCCDDESKCPHQVDEHTQVADYRNWRTSSFVCPAGTKKVLFVCENLKGQSEGACGIDKIQLFQSTGGDPSEANQPACGAGGSQKKRRKQQKKA